MLSVDDRNANLPLLTVLPPADVTRMTMDLYAGPEAQRSGKDQLPGINCVGVWEQRSFNSITNEAVNCIHFEFSDGSRLDNAFLYEMRMWSPAELIDALAEVGFGTSRVYQRNPFESRTPTFDFDQISDPKLAVW